MRFLIILTAIFLLGCGIIAIYLNGVVSSGMPSLEQLENPRQDQATQVFSSNDKLLDHFYKQRRVKLELEEIPEDFINGLIAVEDRQFYNHWGIHLKRMFAAMVKNLMAMGIVEGGSTITMQLARNQWLNQRTTIKRKIREMFLAVEIEKAYSKGEILELYTNQVAFGRGAYGLQTAARTYFDKDVDELKIEETAFLVGILKTPEKYNGRDMDVAVRRRNLVLRLMHQQGFITNSQYIKAKKKPIKLREGTFETTRMSVAPHYVEMIRQKFRRDNSVIDKKYDLYRDGLIIHTTLNTKVQKYAEQALEEHLVEFQKLFDRNWNWRWHQKLLDTLLREAIKKRPDYKSAVPNEKKAMINRLMRDEQFVDSMKNEFTTIQTGLVVIEPKTGAILAMVGASPKYMRDHPNSQYSLNHATQIRRQPGSAFKPLVYSLCLEAGLTPDSLVESGHYTYELITGDKWTPGGTHDSAGTKVTLQEGLRRSINSVAARLVTQVINPRAVVSLARRMGIDSPLHSVPAIALGGGGEVKPIELVSAYGTFAYKGYHVEPYYIKKIEDRFGNVLYEKKSATRIRDAMEKQTAITMTRMMQQVIQGGTAWRIKKYFDKTECAGKTGTTNGNTDAWFVGYTPELVAGLWVGFDDQRISFGNYGQGGQAAAPVWGRLMNKIYSDKSLPFKQKKFNFNTIDSTSVKNMRKQMDDYTRELMEEHNMVEDDEQNKKKNQFPELPKREQEESENINQEQ